MAPIIMNVIERRKLLQEAKWAVVPIQVLICGICLTFATPLCCALFEQRVAMSVDDLEPEVREQILSKYPNLQTVYYNKGLLTNIEILPKEACARLKKIARGSGRNYNCNISIETESRLKIQSRF